MTTAPAVPVPTARALRAHLARTRRARRKADFTPPRDWYTPFLATLVLGGLVVQGVRRLVPAGQLGPSAGLSVVPPPSPHAGLLLGAVLLVLCGFALRGSLALGPLLAGPAVRHWVFASPVDRRAALTPRYGAVAAAAALAGAVVGGLAALVAATGVLWWAIVWWAVAGAAVGAAIVASAVLWQAGRVAAGRIAGTVLVGVGAAAAAVAILVPAGVVVPGLPAVDVASGCWVVAAVLLGLGWQRLGRLDRAALAAGSGLAAALQVAGTFLDPGLLLGMIEERRWRSARRGRSRPGAGRGYAALLHADLRRVLRTPGGPSLAVLMLLVPYAGALVFPAAVPALAAIAVWAVAARAATGLRTVNRSAALRRTIGGSDRQLVAVHLVAPLVVAVVCTAAVSPALVVLHPLAAVLMPIGAVLVVERSSARREPDYGAALFDTGFGAVPVDTVRRLLTVPVLLAVHVVVQVLLGR